MHSVLSVVELRRGDIAAAARHIAWRPVTSLQFADIYARPETIAAEAQVTEARDGPIAALSRVRQLWADLEARPGLLLGDPALSAWLARTALAAGDSELAARTARTSQALADAHPSLPALAAAAAHSQGLVNADPARLAQAAAQHPDPWARASATEDLAVLHSSRGERGPGDQPSEGSHSMDTARSAPTATRPASGGGCANSVSAAATGTRPPPGPSPGGGA